MPIPINILVNNIPVIHDVESCNLDFSEDNYCFTVSLGFKSTKFWSLCNPTPNHGILTIKVIIGDTTYQFLCEERETDHTSNSIAFTVWGRSKQALLSYPFSKMITDDDSLSNVWQTATSKVSDIIAFILSTYSNNAVSISWDVEDFMVLQGTLTVSNESPIEVISKLAEVGGFQLKANIDGTLSVVPYSVVEGTSEENYTDLDDIIQLSESVKAPSGFNAVTVSGFSTDAPVFISAELLEEDEAEPDTCFDVIDEASDSFQIGVPFTVRCYYFHPDKSDAAVLFYGTNGVLISEGTSGEEEITEDVQLTFGTGNTSKPNLVGISQVTGDLTIPIAIQRVTYKTFYKDFIITPMTEGETLLMFYFDKENNSTYSFTIEEASSSDDICSSIKLETEEELDDEVRYISGGTQRICGCVPEMEYEPYTSIIKVYDHSETGEGPIVWPLTEGEWYELESKDVREKEDYSFLSAAMMSLNLGGKWKNITINQDSISGVNTRWPKNNTSPSELIAPLYDFDETVSVQRTTRAINTSSGKYEYKDKDFIETITHENVKQSAELEMAGSDLFFDTNSGYGRRVQNSVFSSKSELVVYVAPVITYKSLPETRSVYDSLNARWVDYTWYSIYEHEDNRPITSAILAASLTGKWKMTSTGIGYRNRSFRPEELGVRELIVRLSWTLEKYSLKKTVGSFSGGQWSFEDQVEEKFGSDMSPVTDATLQLSSSDKWANLDVDSNINSTTGEVIVHIYGQRILRELSRDATYSPGDKPKIRAYYDGTYPTYSWTSIGSLSAIATRISETREEYVTFLNGEAQVSYPISVLNNITFYSGSGAVSWEVGSNTIKVNAFKRDKTFRFVEAKINYDTKYDLYELAIPSFYLGDKASVGFCFNGCSGPFTLDMTIGNKSVTSSGIVVKKDGAIVSSNVNEINFVEEVEWTR